MNPETDRCEARPEADAYGASIHHQSGVIRSRVRQVLKDLFDAVIFGRFILICQVNPLFTREKWCSWMNSSQIVEDLNGSNHDQVTPGFPDENPGAADTGFPVAPAVDPLTFNMRPPWMFADGRSTAVPTC